MALHSGGEFHLIHEIQRSLPGLPSYVIRGMGDDAALLKVRPGRVQVVTTDIMVENVHYDLKYTPLDSLGWKVLAVNLSDIAAMAGEPRCALVNLGLTDSWTDAEVLQVYEGLIRCSEIFKCPVVGGDTVKSMHDSFIGITIIGDVEENRAVLRSGARIGDVICVTGDLGGSQTGFEVLSQTDEEYTYPKSTLKFLEPKPLIRAARILMQTGGVHAMIDISDGLASEIHHICKDSGVGCCIKSEDIPISSEAVRWCDSKNKPPIPFALSSGEEYELLFTCSPSVLDHLETVDCAVTQIGEIVPRSAGIILVDTDGEKLIVNAGWDHFG